MDAHIFKLLKETYYGKSSVEDIVADRLHYSKPKTLSQSEWKALLASPFPPNDYETASHDEMVERILAADAELEWDDVLDGFVLGCLGVWKRGIQTAISCAFARNLEPHAYRAAERYDGCEICELKQSSRWDRTDQVFRCYWGYGWNEMLWRCVPDLEERVSVRAGQPSTAQRRAFGSILRAIDEAPAGETPAELAARLGRAKLLPKTDKYRRYGILLALSELGVMPSTIAGRYDELVGVSARLRAWQHLRGSSLPMPLAAWRGEDGVDWERAEELFYVGTR